VSPAERQSRSELRTAVVLIADADALTDPWWDVALALDRGDRLDEIRELVRVASFDRPPGDRGAEHVEDLLQAIEEAK